MKISILKTRFIGYVLLLAVCSWFLFNFLLNRQSSIMYQYFIEKPSSYNLERAERLSGSIYNSFKKEVPSPALDNIRTFINKYNDIPFLSVNFIYRDNEGLMRSVLNEVGDIDILSAEYVYPIKYEGREIGTLMVYDINKEYKKGLKEYNNMLNITRSFFGLLLFLLLSILLFREYNAVIERQKRIAEYQAVHDGLTGLYTQKYFKGYLKNEISRSQRYQRPLSLIMCDVDYFKQFNDTYGHLAGDKALRTVARIIGENVRTSDVVTRYGGEEFAILLIETGLEDAKNVVNRLRHLTEQAIEIANRIKQKVEKTQFQIDAKDVKLTISMGVASYNGEKDYKPEYLISEADHALYESKHAGRNRTTLFDPETKEFKEAS